MGEAKGTVCGRFAIVLGRPANVHGSFSESITAKTGKQHKRGVVEVLINMCVIELFPS